MTARERPPGGEPAVGGLDWRYRSAPADGLLAEVADAVGLGAFAVEVATGMTTVSDAFYRLLGLDPVADAYLWDRVHPEDVPLIEVMVDRAMREGRPFAFEVRIFDGAGATRMLLVNGRVRRDEAGAPERLVGTMQDVTELRLADPVAAEHDLLVAESQRLARVGSWQYDVAAATFRGSAELFRLYGLAPLRDASATAALAAAVHAEDRQRVQDRAREALATGKGYEHEFRIVRADGEVRHVRGRTVVIAGPDGRPARLVGAVRDITKERRTEAWLVEALAIAKMGRWEWDMVTNAVTWSDELVRLLGIGSDALGHDAASLRDLVHPDDLPDVERVGRAALAGPEPFSFEFRLRGVPGEGRTLLLRGQTAFGPDGRAVRQFGTIQDVTEARGTEEALRRSIAVMAVQQDASPDGFLMVDEHARVLSSNRRFREMWRIPTDMMDEAADRRLLDYVVHQVVDPAAFVARVQDLYAQPGEVAEEEIRLADGRVFERYTAPAVAPDGAFYGRLWIFRDITERKRLEAALQAQYEQLRELDRLKVTFINAVSHELRVPLTSVLGYAEFIEEMLATAAPAPAALEQAREYLATVQVNARRLQVLVDDLLDFALLEAGMFQLRKEPGDFVQRVREAAVGLRPQAARQAQAIELDLPAGPVPVAMDGQRIGQVLSNLLMNALKFTPPSVPVVVRVVPRPGRVRCEVADAGGGIAPEDLPRLFQRYGQLEAGKRRGGSGLGLYISKALVEAHGGAIGVESQPGEGSTFWFELPA